MHHASDGGREREWEIAHCRRAASNIPNRVLAAFRVALHTMLSAAMHSFHVRCSMFLPVCALCSVHSTLHSPVTNKLHTSQSVNSTLSRATTTIFKKRAKKVTKQKRNCRHNMHINPSMLRRSAPKKFLARIRAPTAAHKRARSHTRTHTAAQMLSRVIPNAQLCVVSAELRGEFTVKTSSARNVHNWMRQARAHIATQSSSRDHGAACARHATDEVENQFTFFSRRDRKQWRQTSRLISMFTVCSSGLCMRSADKNKISTHYFVVCDFIGKCCRWKKDKPAPIGRRNRIFKTKKEERLTRVLNVREIESCEMWKRPFVTRFHKIIIIVVPSSVCECVPES